MDSVDVPFVWNSNGTDVCSSPFADTTLRLNSQSVVAVAPCVSHVGANKRKRTAGDEVSSKHEISLALELGSSLYGRTDFAAAGTALVSGRDVGKEVSVDLCLDLKIDLGYNVACANANNSCLEAPNKEGPKAELSFCTTGAADSDLTSITMISTPIQNVTSEVEQLVDEGSISSKWRQGHIVPLDDRLNVNPILVDPSVPAVSVTSSLINTDDSTCSKQQRKTPVKTCQFPDCQKGARGASGYCIAHGGGKRCQRTGCQKGTEGKTALCKAHGGGRRCDHLGCTKSAEGRTSRCIAHGGGKRCGFPGGCNVSARGKSGLCIRHGGGKRCKIENCAKSAEGVAGLCIAHGGGRRCQFLGCTKGAQGGTKFCKAHGGGKRCTSLGCTKGAEGSTAFCKGHGGGKRCSFQGDGACTKSVHGGTLYCVLHGGGKRCAVSGCRVSARGRTDFCVRHGGGKRCKFDGCEKSAQGSTDFCKAHGGRKRCLWGQQGSEFDGDSPCDKFSRGKIGLCGAHGAQVQDKRVHGDGTVGLKMKGIVSEDLFDCTNNVGAKASSTVWNDYNLQMVLPDGKPLLGQSGQSSNSASLEGRVHGGDLMAMMRQS